MIVPFVPPISTLEVSSLPPSTISSFNDTSMEPSFSFAFTSIFLSPAKFNVLPFSGFTTIEAPLLSVAVQPAFTVSDTSFNCPSVAALSGVVVVPFHSVLESPVISLSVISTLSPTDTLLPT